jgi:hypothetical protein
LRQTALGLGIAAKLEVCAIFERLNRSAVLAR